MSPDDFQKSLDAEAAKNKEQQNKDSQLRATNKAGIKTVQAINENTQVTKDGLNDVKGEVKVTNPDLAKTGDVDKAVEAINKLNLTTFMSNEGLPKLAQNLSDLSDKAEALQQQVENEGLKKVSDQLGVLVSKLTDVSKLLSKSEVTVDAKLQKTIDSLSKSIDKIDFSPSVNVSAPDTKIVTTPIDLTSVVKGLSAVEKAISAQEPSEAADLEPIVSGLGSVQNAITSLRFPVPNYVLPFKDSSGKDVQVQLDASGNIPTTGGGGSGGTQYAELNTTSPATGTVALGRYKASPPSLTDGQLYGLELDVNGNLKVAGTFSASTPSDIAPATQNITVVDSSSSSALGANGQSVIIGTPTAGSAASFTLASIETVRVEVTGIWTGTIASEISIDGGTTWIAQGLHQGAYTTSSFIAGFIGGGNVSGATNFRIRATAAITGTATVKIIESVNTQSVYIANAAPAGNVTSLLNSTTATLTSGSIYTGTGEDVSNFSEMRVSVFANVASATDGLSLQQSSDNTNWDITDTYTIAAASAGQGKTFVVPRQARYFRVVYTNGGTNQANFRLQSILNRTATAPSSNRPGDAYTNETDLVQHQAFPSGYNGTTWDRLRTVGTGVLKTDSSSVAGTATSVNNGTTDAGTQRVSLSSDSTGQVKLATGANVIGHVIADTGSTTAVTGSVTVIQPTGTNLHAVLDATSTTTVTQATAANLNATVIGAGSAGTANTGVVTVQGIASMTKLLVTPDSVALPANQSVNVSQINAVIPLMGNGVTGTGSQRVTIASDNTAFAVNATLSAETTKVIGTVNQGTSPWVVSGTVTANAGTNLNTSLLALESGGNLAIIASAVRAEDSASADADKGIGALAIRKASPGNTSGTDGDYEYLQMNAGRLWASATIDSALPAGTNVIGHAIIDTGSTTAVTQATASNLNATVVGTGTFVTQSTLAAETTKVIGVVRNADGSGNLLTSTANALDVNLKTSGLSNLSTNVAQINGVTPLMGNGTTGTGSQRVTIASDNTAFSVNANQGTAASLTAGWTVVNGEQNDTTGTFTNATQSTSVTATNLAGYGNVLISINGTYGTATAIFEGSDDGGTTWYGISEAARTDSNTVEGGYTSLTNTTRAWQVNNPGWDSLRVHSSAVASGTVNVRISPSAAPSAAGATVAVGVALPTGSNVIGHVIADSGSTTAVTQATAANLNATVVGTGTLAVQTTSDTPGTGATNLGKAEDAGHTTGDTGVMALGVRNDTLAATTNTTADYTQLTTDQAGILITAGAPRALKGVPTDTTITSSTAETTVLAAVASTFLDVYGATFTNSSATATKVTLRDNTAGTVRWVGYVPAGDMRGFMLPVDSAVPQNAVNTNWTVTCGTSVASLDVTLFYVKRV